MFIIIIVDEAVQSVLFIYFTVSVYLQLLRPWTSQSHRSSDNKILWINWHCRPSNKTYRWISFIFIFSHFCIIFYFIYLETANVPKNDFQQHNEDEHLHDTIEARLQAKHNLRQSVHQHTDDDQHESEQNCKNFEFLL